MDIFGGVYLLGLNGQFLVGLPTGVKSTFLARFTLPGKIYYFCSFAHLGKMGIFCWVYLGKMDAFTHFRHMKCLGIVIFSIKISMINRVDIRGVLQKHFLLFIELHNTISWITTFYQILWIEKNICYKLVFSRTLVA